MNSSPAIFISYRRSDAAGYAFALWRELRRRFDAEHLFFDQDKSHLPLGRSWDDSLRMAIDSTRACLVVIGPDWLDVRAADGLRRLDDSADVVRREVARALERADGGKSRDMIVIPILFGSAAIPKAEELPSDLQLLPTLQGTAFDLGLDFDAAFDRLVDALARHTGLPAKTQFAAHRQVFHLPSQQLSRCFVDPADQLSRLRQLLHTQGNAAVLAAATVQGMGGVGKTQLALQYSQRQRKDYYGIWWFRAESTALLDQDCAAFCEALRIPVPQGIPHHQALRDRLAQEPRWLLVYDNAEDARTLQDYLPAAGRHHVIITSRLPNWQYAEGLHLDVWTDEQALEFLRPRLPKADDRQRRALAQALGGLPLALEQACAYLDKTGAEIAAYITGIDDFERQNSLLDREDSALCPRSVLTTLSLAFNRLSEPARALLHLCAWLAPEPIPEYLFTESAGLLPPALATRTGDPLTWRETVAELTGYALCQTSAEPTTLTFHRLTQAALRLHHRDMAETEAGQSLALLHTAFPAETGQPTHWARCEVLAPHVLQLQAWRGKKLSLDASRLSWLLDRLANYLTHARGLYDEAERLQRWALEIVLGHFGEEHPNTLVVLDHLAATIQAQGDLADARKLRESVLAIRRRVLGEQHPATLSSMNDLAATLRTQGDLAGSRALHQQTLDLRRLVLGEEHAATLSSMNNLAVTVQAMGDLGTASVLHQHVLDARCRVLGDEDLDTLTSMNNLAETLRAQGDLAGARAWQEKVVAKRGHVLGDDHPATLASMNNLAVTLQVLGDLAGAIALQERVLSLSRSVLGDEHPNSLRSMGNLALTLQAQGDLADAKLLQQQVLAGSRRVLGDEHPATLIAMNNLAGTLSALGDLASARALHEEELATCRRVLGSKHPDTLTSLNNLAAMIQEQGDLPKARKLAEEALAASRRVLGARHLGTSVAAANLVSLLLQTGNTKNARNVIKSNLAWLLAAELESLSADQRKIRDRLLMASQKGPSRGHR